MIQLNVFGQNARLDHIGVVVKSIRDVSPSSQVVTDKIQKVSVAFVILNGVKIELVEPYGHLSPVAASLSKGTKFLHMCYRVSDIERILKGCRKHGFHLIKRPVPAVAFGNKRIAWVYSDKYGLFELLEDS